MNAYRQAANYLSVGQIYLYDNPLLRKPIGFEHVKPDIVIEVYYVGSREKPLS